jgi:two-component system, NarL family, response regulator
MKTTEVIRVLVADDHSIVRQGVVALINRRREMKVIAEAGNGRIAVMEFNRHHPDISLIDLRMPEMDGVEAIRAIRQIDPNANIIVLTTFDDDEDIYRALRNGAKAYLLKDISKDELVETILAVRHGITCIPAHVAQKLADHVRNSDLTTRELQVLRLLAVGKSNKSIASLLQVSVGTIKVHVNHIMKKLGTSGRTEAANIALKRGIIRLDEPTL